MLKVLCGNAEDLIGIRVNSSEVFSETCCLW